MSLLNLGRQIDTLLPLCYDPGTTETALWRSYPEMRRDRPDDASTTCRVQMRGVVPIPAGVQFWKMRGWPTRRHAPSQREGAGFFFNQEEF